MKPFGHLFWVCNPAIERREEKKGNNFVVVEKTEKREEERVYLTL
jgi:hypothetical protein